VAQRWNAAGCLRRAPAIAGTALCALLALTACHGEHARQRDQEHDVQVGDRDSLPLGPGDIRILNADSTVELALVGEKVTSGLSPKMLAQIRSKTSATEDSGSGLGSSISRMVKSAVNTAVAKQVSYPISDIKDVRYEGGRLVFVWKDGKPMNLLEHSNVNGKPVLQSFRPEDAQAFVKAFRTRKAALTTPE
jgi:hypothetical protein